MMGMNLGDIMLTSVIIFLIVLFFVSLALFMKGYLTGQRNKRKRSEQIEEKLDRIIELLEEKKYS